MKKIIIIGAGPAGMFAAINAKLADKRIDYPGNLEENEVILIDKNSEIGKKLKISGSGQCNFTHTGDVGQFSTHYGDKSKIASRILRRFDNQKTIDFFSEIGVSSFEREDGKVFPNSLKSRDIINALKLKMEELSVHTILNQNINSIERKGDLFHLSSSDKNFICEKLIVATGGNTYIKTGSDGSMYKILKDMGESVTELRTGLTPIFIKNFEFSDISGISFENATMNFVNSRGKKKNAIGNLLFTHKGLSGPLILDNSRYLNAGDCIRLNFTGFENSSDMEECLIDKSATCGNVSLKRILSELGLPQRLVERLMDICEVDKGLKMAQLGKKVRRKIVDSFTAYEFKIWKLGNVNESMITVGGIDLKSLNLSTMESKRIPGLYYCGEVLDIDGDTGGYNIQMAFSSGYIAGVSAGLNSGR